MLRSTIRAILDRYPADWVYRIVTEAHRICAASAPRAAVSRGSSEEKSCAPVRLLREMTAGGIRIADDDGGRVRTYVPATSSDPSSDAIFVESRVEAPRRPDRSNAPLAYMKNGNLNIIDRADGADRQLLSQSVPSRPLSYRTEFKRHFGSSASLAGGRDGGGDDANAGSRDNYKRVRAVEIGIRAGVFKGITFVAP